MRGVNKVIVVGNLGADPDVRYSQGGTAICNLSVATKEEWKDKQSGQKQERTEWHKVTLFGRLAEIAGEYLKKGRQVYIEGSLRTEEYEKDGVKHYPTKIIASDLQMLGGGDGGGQQRQGGSRGAGTQRRQSAPIDNQFDDDDIPF